MYCFHVFLVQCVLCREVYDKVSPGFRGRCTAPLLVDGRTKRPVSNESSDMLRMLNEVDLPGGTGVDLYPVELRPQIDTLNDQVRWERTWLTSS